MDRYFKGRGYKYASMLVCGGLIYAFATGAEWLTSDTLRYLIIFLYLSSVVLYIFDNKLTGGALALAGVVCFIPWARSLEPLAVVVGLAFSFAPLALFWIDGWVKNFPEYKKYRTEPEL